MKEVNVGEKFKTIDGIELVVVEEKTGLCRGCFFNENKILCTRKDIPICSASFRNDSKEVVFKKVE